MKIKILILLIAFFILSGVINDIKADKQSIKVPGNDYIIGETETTGVLGANSNFVLDENDLSNDMVDKKFTDEVIKEYDAQLRKIYQK
ncbi:MAG: hypothetical protein AB7V50_08610 [Vampirovibrionia bacterium]